MNLPWFRMILCPKSRRCPSPVAAFVLLSTLLSAHCWASEATGDGGVSLRPLSSPPLSCEGWNAEVLLTHYLCVSVCVCVCVCLWQCTTYVNRLWFGNLLVTNNFCFWREYLLIPIVVLLSGYSTIGHRFEWSAHQRDGWKILNLGLQPLLYMLNIFFLLYSENFRTKALNDAHIWYKWNMDWFNFIK